MELLGCSLSVVSVELFIFMRWGLEKMKYPARAYEKAVGLSSNDYVGIFFLVYLLNSNVYVRADRKSVV